MPEKSVGVSMSVKIDDMDLPFDVFAKRWLEPAYNQLQADLKLVGPDFVDSDGRYMIAFEAVK